MVPDTNLVNHGDWVMGTHGYPLGPKKILLGKNVQNGLPEKET